MQVVPLIDHPELLNTVAAALYDAFGHSDPNASFQRGIARLTSRLNQDQLPFCLIAHDNGEFLGTASVVIEELTSHSHLTPWLSGVLVQSTHRRRGIGTALVSSCVELAANFGVRRMYLFTPDSTEFYGRLGWQHVEAISNAYSTGTIMSRPVARYPSLNTDVPHEGAAHSAAERRSDSGR